MKHLLKGVVLNGCIIIIMDKARCWLHIVISMIFSETISNIFFIIMF